MSVRRLQVLVALGANATIEGQTSSGALHSATRFLQMEEFTDFLVSPYYSSPAFPAGSGPDYVNAVVSFRASALPHVILAKLHQIEARLGRERGTRWGSRTVDLDLLAVGDAVLPDRRTYSEWRNLPLERQMHDTPDQLILPHPRIEDRAFVLKPLADIAPDWQHPVTGRSVTQMLEALPMQDRADVRQLSGKNS